MATPSYAPAARSSTPSGSTKASIEVSGLRKSFGKKVVLDGIDLRVAEGTVFALLGPNGAHCSVPTAARCGSAVTTWRASRTPCAA